MQNNDKLLAEVNEEIARAKSLHKPQTGLHEGYAVMLEKVDEVWDEIKKKKPDYDNLRKKLIQVAACALRTIIDVVDKTSSEKLFKIELGRLSGYRFRSAKFPLAYTEEEADFIITTNRSLNYRKTLI